jgi:hypothetical protein
MASRFLHTVLQGRFATSGSLTKIAVKVSSRSSEKVISSLGEFCPVSGHLLFSRGGDEVSGECPLPERFGSLEESLGIVLEIEIEIVFVVPKNLVIRQE